jgi:hypothetical protein
MGLKIGDRYIEAIRMRLKTISPLEISWSLSRRMGHQRIYMGKSSKRYWGSSLKGRSLSLL